MEGDNNKTVSLVLVSLLVYDFAESDVYTGSFLTGSSGSIVYSDLDPGRYFIRVQASNAKEDRAIMRRNFEITQDPEYCTVHLINDGITVSENTVTVEFTGVGPAESFDCQLDRGTHFECKCL